MLKSTQSVNEDIFKDTYPYLCQQGRKAIFALRRKFSHLGSVPSSLMFEAFETMVRPILLYGSDIWGNNKNGQSSVDKVYLQFMRYILHVKPSTSNIIVMGECGKFPPSVYCNISVMCFFNRLHHMNENRIPKQVFSELVRLNDIGFNNWTTGMCELINSYTLDIELPPHAFKIACKNTVLNRFLIKWHKELLDIPKHHPV